MSFQIEEKILNWIVDIYNIIIILTCNNINLFVCNFIMCKIRKFNKTENTFIVSKHPFLSLFFLSHSLKSFVAFALNYYKNHYCSTSTNKKYCFKFYIYDQYFF